MRFNRRRLLEATVAAGASLLAGMKAHAKFAGDVQLRGQIGRLERLPTRDLESAEDFRTTLRSFANGDLNAAAARRAEEIFRAAGLNPNEKVSTEDAVRLLTSDPVIMNQTHTWITNQLAMWRDTRDAFYADADMYLSEMAAADKSGPGTLELNPKMHIPPYTTHEIHNQPGGYVGEAFAGHLYHYGTNNLYIHNNDQDARHAATVANVPVPEKGKVRRILDLGCSVGQTAVAMKERFPEAEVWSIDIGGPMVRYAHMRAADLGVDVNFAQRLAEDTKFPANHFDIVIANILFHEVSPDATPKIIAEVSRVLAPGGVFYPNEPVFQLPRPPDTAWSRFRGWWNDQWNSEVWFIPYSDYDYAKTFKQVGLNVGNTAKGRSGNNNMIATKPA